MKRLSLSVIGTNCQDGVSVDSIFNALDTSMVNVTPVTNKDEKERKSSNISNIGNNSKRSNSSNISNIRGSWEFGDADRQVIDIGFDDYLCAVFYCILSNKTYCHIQLLKH